MNICMYVCVLHVGVWICIHLCQCIQNGRYKSTSTKTCISNHTSAVEQFGNCSLFGEGLARGHIPVFKKYSKC